MGQREKLNEREKLRGATTTKLLQHSNKWNYSFPLPAWLLSSSAHKLQSKVVLLAEAEEGLLLWKDGAVNEDQVPQEDTAFIYYSPSRHDDTSW